MEYYGGTYSNFANALAVIRRNAPYPDKITLMGRDRGDDDNAQIAFTCQQCVDLIAALKANTRLTHLAIRYGTNLEDGGYHLGVCLGVSLETNVTLKVLQVYNVAINEGGMIRFLKGLSANRGVDTLELSFRPASLSVMQHLVDAMRVNTTIRTLDLSSSTLKSDTASLIGDILSTNRTLTTLKLVSTLGIDDAAMMRILKGLSDNRTLETFDISYNKFDAAGQRTLAASLTSDIHVKKFVACHTRLMAHASHILKVALSKNTTLEELDVLECFYTFEDALQLFQGVQANRTLKVLRTGTPHGNLEGHVLTFDTDCTPIRDALAHNKSLVVLDFMSDYSTDRFDVAFSEGIAANTSLRELTVVNVGLWNPEAFGNALKLNRTLKVLKTSVAATDALAAMCEGMSANKTVTTLDLRGQWAGFNEPAEALQILANFVSQNENLEQLETFVSRNPDASPQWKALAKAVAMRVASDITIDSVPRAGPLRYVSWRHLPVVKRELQRAMVDVVMREFRDGSAGMRNELGGLGNVSETIRKFLGEPEDWG